MKKEKLQEDDNLLRRVLFLDPNFIKPDGTVASSCFRTKKDEDGLSVEVERFTSFERAITDVKRFRLYSITLKFIKKIELNATHDPLTDNFAHALITGNITRGKAKKIAANAKKVNYPK